MNTLLGQGCVEEVVDLAVGSVVPHLEAIHVSLATRYEASSGLAVRRGPKATHNHEYDGRDASWYVRA